MMLYQGQDIYPVSNATSGNAASSTITAQISGVSGRTGYISSVIYSWTAAASSGSSTSTFLFGTMGQFGTGNTPGMFLNTSSVGTVQFTFNPPIMASSQGVTVGASFPITSGCTTVSTMITGFLV